MSPMRAAILGAALVVAIQAGAASGEVRAVPPCVGHDLTGTFKYVQYSQGAGNLSYALRLRNVSTHTCFVTGIPDLQLLSAAGKTLPTHPAAAHPGELTAIMVRLVHNASAVATARFSPDVPGPGEQHPGRCEPIASKIRVSPQGGGTLVAPITPPTSVCEHGSMTFTVLVKAS